MARDPEPSLGDLETEGINSATADLDRLSPLEMVTLMNAADAEVVAAVKDVLLDIALAVEEVAGRLRGGGRLIYVGAGTSGRLGVLDASECPPTFSTPPEMVVGLIAGGDAALRSAVEEAEDRPEAGEEDIEDLSVGAQDAVVGITASGRTPYVLGAVRRARRHGALTVGITCNRGTPLEALTDITITPLVGPEVIAGSTRLKAGTATKMVLNMLSTGAMVSLGKTYGNLMVDLRATSGKLRDRAHRILQTSTGLQSEDAMAHLQAADGELKTAIVTALTGLSPADARRELASHGGNIRALLQGADLQRDATLPNG